EVVMVRGTGRIHLGGPPIVKAAINEIVDGETLGGADMHATVSGVTDHVAATETDAIGRLREIVLGFGALRLVSPPPFAPVPPLADPAELSAI
ncbi:carboxyl transferase domain-containing protein, partial [Acinetobacter baumannii]